MKYSVLPLMIVGLLSISACATLQPAASTSTTNSEPSKPIQIQTKPAETTKYVQILDELISNGCNVSVFEMVERKQVLDMKIACK